MILKLKLGDSLEVLKKCPDNYVDSIVTDPPYGLSFMGKKWDYDVPSAELWKECLRVLKPGGHLLAFGGTRTYHRLVVAIEAAGFEIRDQIQWIYSQGFPKSQDISKAIDKAAGAEREIVGKSARHVSGKPEQRTDGLNGSSTFQESVGMGMYITAPATPEAKQWSGWGSALKPANEPICLARKPLSEPTLAKNVLKHGTGAINIDASRVGFQSEADKASAKPQGAATSKAAKDGLAKSAGVESERGKFEVNQSMLGRFPANAIFDEDAAKVLDGQVGSDVSRFFYVAKASKSDRNSGLAGTDIVNNHATVKPIKLMEYLIKLITPPNGIVLDPFMGSGTTGVAAKRLGFGFVGVELTPEYFEIAKQRIEGVKDGSE